MNFMSPWICRVFWKAFWVGLLGAFSGLRSEEAAVRAVWNDSAVRISLVGSAREDWFLESSTRLTNWVREPGAPPLVAGPAGGPERTIPLADGRTDRFFRAVRTDGLFDKTFLRTFHLRFQQADWNESLVKAHGTDSNVVCRLESEHGQVLDGVGARYKGYSSFAPDRTKNSLNLTLDFLNPTNRLLGYETVNLNNAWGDPTLLREAIYFGVFTRYAPGPRAGIARLFINGENRGVYSLAQQEDSDLIREWFPSASGDRWRTPNKGGVLTPVDQHQPRRLSGVVRTQDDGQRDERVEAPHAGDRGAQPHASGAAAGGAGRLLCGGFLAVVSGPGKPVRRGRQLLAQGSGLQLLFRARERAHPSAPARWK